MNDASMDKNGSAAVRGRATDGRYVVSVSEIVRNL